MKEDYD